MNQTNHPLLIGPYEFAPQPVIAMERDYPAAYDTGKHKHVRAQLVYARSGVMKVMTEAGTWVIPPLRAVWVPGGMQHRVVMVSAVQIRTLYVALAVAKRLPEQCTVVEVGGLLRELIYALLEEPVEYMLEGRGGLLAQLILHELRGMQVMPLHLPIPKDARLLRLCRTLLDDPGATQSLEMFAEQCGASTRTLARLFQSETGMSFRTWRQQLRLIEALSLLAQGQPVGRVASALGYRSQSAFAVMFQRALGIEPSRYFCALGNL